MDAADADAVVVVVTTLLNLYFTMKFLLFLLVGLLEVHVLACIHSYCGNSGMCYWPVGVLDRDMGDHVVVYDVMRGVGGIIHMASPLW